MYTQGNTEVLLFDSAKMLLPYSKISSYEQYEAKEEQAACFPFGKNPYENIGTQDNQNIWIKGIAAIDSWENEPDLKTTIFWSSYSQLSYDKSSDTFTPELPIKSDTLNKPGTLGYLKSTLGEKTYNSLSKEDKQFLKAASSMFNLGDNIKIDRILQSLGDEMR